MAVFPTESAETKQCMCEKGSKSRNSREKWSGG